MMVNQTIALVVTEETGEAFCALAATPLVVWTKPSAALGDRPLTRRIRLGDLAEEGVCDD